MKKIILLFSVVVLLPACSSKFLTGSTNISQQKLSYDKVMVIGKTKSDVTRRSFENRVVARLESEGVNAVSSAKYGLEIEGELDEEKAHTLREKLDSEGFDGVLITSLLDIQNSQHVVHEAHTRYQPTVVYGSFRTYVGYHPVTYWGPDRVVNETNYILESALYRVDLENDNLQWVGHFAVDAKNKLGAAEDQYTKELVNALIKDSISQ